MKISKFIFILIAIILISTLIIYYFFTNNYNLEKIIADIKKNYDVSVILNEDPEWSFNNEVALKFNAKINDENQDFNSENMEFIFVQPYNISPINVDIETESLNFRGLKIQLLKLNGKYSFLNKILNLNKLSAKIGEGNINLQGKLNQSKENKFNLSGSFKNLYLNQIFRQLNFTDWKRLELKISSKDLFLNGKIGFLDIVKTIEKIFRDKEFNKYAQKKPKSIKDVKITDKWARLKTINMCVR